MMDFIEDQIFDKLGQVDGPLPPGIYERCTFNACDFSYSGLSDIQFQDCRFLHCNLSLANLNKMAFRDVQFSGCKMPGLRFDLCNPFAIAFTMEGCTLDHSSFYKLKIRKTTFKNCRLTGVDFTDCDITGSLFDACDLERATFQNTVAEKTDFRTAFNYSIDPDINRLKKARFSKDGLAGLLGKYGIEIE